MLNISGKLKHKIDIYARKEYFDKSGAKGYDYVKLKSTWAAISPIIGERVRVVKKDKIGGMEYTSSTIRFILRIDAVRVTKDMYFVYRGQKFDVDYALPIYKDMKYQEVYTQLRIENDSNEARELNFYADREDT